MEAEAEAEGGGWGCGGRIGIGEWGREGEMDGLGWIRSLGCSAGEEARNESFPLSFLHLFPLTSVFSRV